MARPTFSLIVLTAFGTAMPACAPEDAETSPAAETQLHAEVTGQTAAMQLPPAEEAPQSTFGGRCSVPSNWVIRFTMEGRDETLGDLHGEAEHCSQVLTWIPMGSATVPDSVTYGNGEFTLVTAGGDTLRGSYGSGVAAARPDGTTWFKDEFRVTGGSGRFAEATGSGTDEGVLANPDQPFTMRVDGVLRYPALTGIR